MYKLKAHVPAWKTVPYTSFLIALPLIFKYYRLLCYIFHAGTCIDFIKVLTPPPPRADHQLCTEPSWGKHLCSLSISATSANLAVRVSLSFIYFLPMLKIRGRGRVVKMYLNTRSLNSQQKVGEIQWYEMISQKYKIVLRFSTNFCIKHDQL